MTDHVLDVGSGGRIWGYAGLFQGLAILLGYPDAESRRNADSALLAHMAEFCESIGSDPGSCEELTRPWLTEMGDQEELALKREHTALFLFGAPRSPAPLYESVHLTESGLLAEQPALEVAEYYSSAGVQLSEDAGLPPDHLVFELEFVALLLRRSLQQAEDERQPEAARSLESAEEFIRLHPARWVSLLAEAIRVHASLPYYPSLVSLLEEALSHWTGAPTGPRKP